MTAGRRVGLDFGDVRTGVAVSDPLGIIASPYGNVDMKDSDGAIDEIQRIVSENEAVEVVVGLPLDQNGEIGPQARKVLDFVDKLQQRLELPIVTQDERFSTALADRSLREASMSGRKRRKVIDRMAAQQILQLYLDRMSRSGSAGTATDDS